MRASASTLVGETSDRGDWRPFEGPLKALWRPHQSCRSVREIAHPIRVGRVTADGKQMAKIIIAILNWFYRF
jgi:hypothetical protein